MRYAAAQLAIFTMHLYLDAGAYSTGELPRTEVYSKEARCNTPCRGVLVINEYQLGMVAPIPKPD